MADLRAGQLAAKSRALCALLHPGAGSASPELKRGIPMTDDMIDLDGHRSPAGKIATDIRRHALQEFEADREALRRQQQELEAQLLASPAENWTEAAAKAQYLIRLYASDGGRPRRAPQEADRAGTRRSRSPDRSRGIGMRDVLEPSSPRPRPADVPTLRQCLRCRATFPSEGFGERICRHCKSSKDWRSASPLALRSSARR